MPPHQFEAASQHLEETMKIEEALDASRQPTLDVPQNQPQLLTKTMSLQQLTMNFKNCVTCNKHLNQ